jgi:rSAM/selenodomain-associated transferase 1
VTRPTLIVMVKEPRAGRVKTRLGSEIGMPAAAWWFRHQARSLLRRIRDPRWQVVLALTPDRDAVQSRFWPRDLPRFGQGRGDLGQRMARALGRFRGPVVLIGADIPEVRKSHIADAFAALGSARSVVGPSTDGGFWLIGLRHSRPRRTDLFAGVQWSHQKTLQDTLPRLPAPVATVATLSDVDRASDLALHPTAASRDPIPRVTSKPA